MKQLLRYEQTTTMSSEIQEFKGIPKLSAVTYSAWKRAMAMALMSECCLDIVQGKEVALKALTTLPDNPAPTAEAVNGYNQVWERYEMRFSDYKSRFGKAGWLINQSLTKKTEVYVQDTTNLSRKRIGTGDEVHGASDSW